MTEELTTDGATEPAPSGESGSEPAPQTDTKPVTFTQEQADALVAMAVGKASQDFRTWSGRRDKALIDQLAGTIDERIGALKPHTGEPIKEEFDFENPGASIDKILAKREHKRTSEAQKFNDAAITGIGKYMDSDPIFKNPEFGHKVLETALQGLVRLRRDVPPNVAAELLVKDAVLEIGREKISGPRSPLEKNTTGKAQFGNVTPPASDSKKAAAYTGPKLSESASKLASKWGYSTESLNKLFPEKE